MKHAQMSGEGRSMTGSLLHSVDTSLSDRHEAVLQIGRQNSSPQAATVSAPVLTTPLRTSTGLWRVQQAVTFTLVGAPMVAVVWAAQSWLTHGITALDLALAAVMYVFVGFGVTAGYHRMLTHRSFAARRPLKVALSIAGAMAFEGGPIGWVSAHRRHHAFSDTERDPHSPKVGGFFHAHMGWLFRKSANEPSCTQDYAKDLRSDRDLVIIDHLFPLWCAASVAIPFFAGWLIGGNVRAGLTALLWAGGVRIFLLHHVTWSINSFCHGLGRRPFDTKDRSTNLAALSLVSFGESWHNGHHAFPRSARHGMLRGQVDPAARLIAIFEKLGWASDVKWPTPQQRDTARIGLL
jgi:stearoyl-CoA desaturase (delta-9 desaturase)